MEEKEKEKKNAIRLAAAVGTAGKTENRTEANRNCKGESDGICRLPILHGSVTGVLLYS